MVPQGFAVDLFDDLPLQICHFKFDNNFSVWGTGPHVFRGFGLKKCGRKLRLIFVTMFANRHLLKKFKKI